MNAVRLLAAVAAIVPVMGARGAFFDFNSAPYQTSLPIDQTVEGITAHFAATGQGFSIQSANALGFTPAGFDGLCIYPNSIYAADLQISFSEALTDFSIMYAPEEYGSDQSAVMKVTAYQGASLVGTNTTMAPNPGTWPTGVLTFSSVIPFDYVVVQWLSAPVGTENWGPIFMADNMNVTPAAVPEGASVGMLGAGVVALWCGRRERVSGGMGGSR